MTTLAVVANGVVSAQTNPLRQRSVLLHLLPQLLLDQQRLVRRLRAEVRNIHRRVQQSQEPGEPTRKKKAEKNFQASRPRRKMLLPVADMSLAAISAALRLREASCEGSLPKQKDRQLRRARPHQHVLQRVVAYHLQTTTPTEPKNLLEPGGPQMWKRALSLNASPGNTLWRAMRSNVRRQSALFFDPFHVGSFWQVAQSRAFASAAQERVGDGSVAGDVTVGPRERVFSCFYDSASTERTWRACRPCPTCRPTPSTW